MPPDSKNEGLQEWERELLADHRWGRPRAWFPGSPEPWATHRAVEEHARLKGLWEKAQPLDPQLREALNSIMALEICNWNLWESIMSLCKAIGARRGPERRIGHSYSITNERWRKTWAYYQTLRKWLPSTGRSTGYDALLEPCDPDAKVQGRIIRMLGGCDELKQLYVEWLCLNLERWIGGFYPEGSPQLREYDAAVKTLDEEIVRLDPDPGIRGWMRLHGGRGWIELCYHKAFRRLDIQISSIWAGRWRGALP